MSRPITIHLSEAQCDALATEAKREGRSFFDHCRQKLLANMSVMVDIPLKAAETSHHHAHTSTPLPTKEPDRRAVVPLSEGRVIDPPTDRIDRLEAMMMQMADAIQNLANPQHMAQAAPGADIDIDDVVNQSLQTAEAAGVHMEPEAPAPQGGVRHLGTRLRSRYAVGQAPSHLQGLVPS